MDTFLDAIAFVARRTLNFLNWRLIRAIGQLQIFTRASYIMLLVVPLLAGTWPAVRLYVNQHNKRAAELTSRLDEANLRFEATQKSIAPTLSRLVTSVASESPEPVTLKQELETSAAKFKDAVNTFNSTVDAFKNDFAERTLKDPKLPWSLAAAFFAALLVVLGHLVYQLCAPEVIKAATLDEFVSRRKEDYAKHPSEDALKRADEFSQTSLGERAQHEERFEAEHLLRRIEDLPPTERLAELRRLRRGRLMSLATFLRSGSINAPHEYLLEIRHMVDEILGDTGQAQYQNMTLIERGAKAEYLYSAGRVPVAILITAALYSVAVCVLLLIIKVQTSSVMEAAGWTSVTKLFSQ